MSKMIDTVCSGPKLAEDNGLTLHEELKASTAQAHRELERAVDLLRRDFSQEDYRQLVIRYHGFYVPFERFLQDMAAKHSAAAQFYCYGRGARLKQGWLESDLRALGIDPASHGSRIPGECFSSLLPSEAHLLGAVYVVEGSMLGGAILSKHFMKRLQLTPGSGLQFFSGYGVRAKENWLATLQFLQEQDRRGLPRADVVDGARNVFRLLQVHLANGPACQSREGAQSR